MNGAHVRSDHMVLRPSIGELACCLKSGAPSEASARNL